ncbi:hypothetical protein BANRA_05380 [Escherichia coli]|nr:hypothetical protein [Escherichia coli]VCW49634.1 hypothetical protein BANRA_05380 [Escherichia coli]
MTTTEQQIELDRSPSLVTSYTYRSDIRDRTTLEANFRAKFEALNRVHPDRQRVSTLARRHHHARCLRRAAQRLRNINSFERDDGTPLNYTRQHPRLVQKRLRGRQPVAYEH